MFTPQRTVWSGLSLTPRREAVPKSGSDPNGVEPSSGDGRSGLRGKSVAFAEPVTPNGVGRALDGEDLGDKVSRLEKELFEYQYNMGLLLIEKKNWASQHEELKQAISDAMDAIKREQAAHLIAISDTEKREENLRKALGVEKQCVTDLEKAVRDMRSENAELKFTADSKLAEANALVASVEEKSLEIEAKLRAADAKLAEVSRKSSEIERKAREVESREAALRRERMSFISEREAHESTFSKQREDLLEWEKKLQEGEERLSKVQRIINQREERTNEEDGSLKQKEKDLEAAQKKIEEANSILKRKEEDITSRLANLAVKEKARFLFVVLEFDATRKKLHMKEDELRALEAKLDERERVEIQKLNDEHNAILDAKKHEFELEIEQKKRSVDEELKGKVMEMERKDVEIKHMEEKIFKREQALDKRLEKLKEKEKEFELKSKAAKEREKVIKSEEKNLATEREKLQADKEDSLRLKAELEKIRAVNEEQLLKMCKEEERLKVTEEERSEYARLQTELKDEIEKCRFQEELLLKDAEDLKQQKENFEREWEELDEKRAEIEKERKSIADVMGQFEKQKASEEERLRSEKQETEDYVKRELEALKVAKESFEANMAYEQSVIAEKAISERNQMLHDIELQKTELENSLQKKREELENALQEKEKEFEEEKERQLTNVNFLRDVARREMEEMKQERNRIEKERIEVDENRKHLEQQQLEMRQDIDKLGDLSRKLKEHRETFIKEKERFILFVEQHKGCKNCGEITSQFMLSDLMSSQEIENADAVPTPRLVNNQVVGADTGSMAALDGPERDMSPTTNLSVSPVSWLRKCTSKIFIFSAGKKVEPAMESAPPVNMEPSKRLDFSENEPESSFAGGRDSIDVPRVQSDFSNREAEAAEDRSANDQSNINSKETEVQADSQPSDSKRGHQPRKRGRPRISRTRSVKAVVQDAKALLGEALEINETEDSDHLKDASRGESSLADKRVPKNARKRGRTHTSQTTASEHYADDSEEHSDSVTTGSRRRRQKVAAVPNPVGNRYNLRRPKLGVSVVTAKASSGLNSENEVEGFAGPEGGNFLRTAPPTASIGLASENGGSTHLVRCGIENGDGTGRNVENAVLSEEVEEVNGTAEGAGDSIAEEYRSESPGGEDDCEESDEETEHPGEVSMGKKLWTFFTT
ncbi:hypothetical protein Tsubulata_005085 [Turnera subulata]|uniref:Nuclear matrix constituent protein 1-like protein n=1 Tax=Turnera subulata TaxID=218843 RepID=A0A9Q0J9P5_9ROSI|nr:hypothetical protein Tsubulata_005085 [Turnera subulata]